MLSTYKINSFKSEYRARLHLVSICRSVAIKTNDKVFYPCLSNFSPFYFMNRPWFYRVKLPFYRYLRISKQQKPTLLPVVNPLDVSLQLNFLDFIRMELKEVLEDKHSTLTDASELALHRLKLLRGFVLGLYATVKQCPTFHSLLDSLRISFFPRRLSILGNGHPEFDSKDFGPYIVSLIALIDIYQHELRQQLLLKPVA